MLNLIVTYSLFFIKNNSEMLRYNNKKITRINWRKFTYYYRIKIYVYTHNDIINSSREDLSQTNLSAKIAKYQHVKEHTLVCHDI